MVEEVQAYHACNPAHGAVSSRGRHQSEVLGAGDEHQSFGATQSTWRSGARTWWAQRRKAENIMKVVVVPVSVIQGLGTRLDSRPYMDAAYETPKTLRTDVKRWARAAYMRAARRGLARVRNLRRFHREVGLDKVRRLT